MPEQNHVLFTNKTYCHINRIADFNNMFQQYLTLLYFDGLKVNS